MLLMIGKRNIKNNALCVCVWCVCGVCVWCVCGVCAQDQVDTLTFQNQGLRDRAKRFEQALRRSTDEQIVVLYYRHTHTPNIHHTHTTHTHPTHINTHTRTHTDTNLLQ